MTATPTTHAATPRRHRARLLVPAAIAALAFTATTAAADTSPATAAERTATAHDRRGAEHKPKTMLDAWLRLWNGDFAQAPGIISPGFRVHAALLDGGDGSSIRGVDGLVAWIGQTRAAFRDLRFTIEVPRWSTAATHRCAGRPPAPTPAASRRQGPAGDRGHLHRHRHTPHAGRQVRGVLGQHRHPEPAHPAPGTLKHVPRGGGDGCAVGTVRCLTCR